MSCCGAGFTPAEVDSVLAGKASFLRWEAGLRLFVSARSGRNQRNSLDPSITEVNPVLPLAASLATHLHSSSDSFLYFPHVLCSHMWPCVLYTWAFGHIACLVALFVFGYIFLKKGSSVFFKISFKNILLRSNLWTVTYTNLKCKLNFYLWI